MSQRATQKSESKRAILQSAAGILRERGAGGASVQGVMAGAGLTVGAFYAHFDDKNALVAEAFLQALDEAKTLVDEAANGETGGEALSSVVSRYLSEEHRDDVRRGCPLPAMLGEAAASDDASTRELFGRAVMTMRDRLSAVASRDVTDDRLLALVALMVGGQILARATRGTPTSSDVLAACRSAGNVLAGSSSSPPARRSR
jgi:TetR/AcrR family transcriptional repressor of nem operon